MGRGGDASGWLAGTTDCSGRKSGLRSFKKRIKTFQGVYRPMNPIKPIFSLKFDF